MKLLNCKLLSKCFCGLLLLLTFATPLWAVYPEDGMYWDPGDAGRGFYVEVQDETVFILVYAYNEESGEAEIYSAAAPIRDDGFDIGVQIIGHPPLETEGYLPLHWVSADLYKVNNGPCLFCIGTGTPFTTDNIGMIYAWFPWSRHIHLSMVSSDGEEAIDLYLQRMEYSRAPIIGGNSGTSFLMPDMSGLWVFVDLANPDQGPWRFNFDERVPDTVFNEIPFEGVFRDSHSGAEWRCTILEQAEREKLNGCELHLDGEVLFAANHRDLSIKKITAFRGPLPELVTPHPGAQPEYYRGPETVIGLRVNAPESASDSD